MSLYRHEIMEKLDAVHPVICVKVTPCCSSLRAGSGVFKQSKGWWFNPHLL